jgi:hypothetical protein
MAARGKGLGRRKEAAITALLTEATLAGAAAQAGISERCLRYWLDEPAFAAAFRSARARVVDRAMTALQQLCLRGVVKLNDLLNSPRDAVALRAATVILSMGLRAVELDECLSRIEALEQAVHERRYPRCG